MTEALHTQLVEAVEFCLNEDNDWYHCREVLRAARLAALAEVEACAPQEQAVIAELAEHIQTARRALADPRTERSILSAGLALDEAFQVLEGRPPVVEARAPQEPSPSERVEQALRLAEQATNGWACYAKRKIEHDDIARLHSAIAALRATPPAAADGRDTPPPENEVGEARAVPPLDWQPIESAPKDGTNILLSDGQTVSYGGWISAADQGAEPEEEFRIAAGWWSVDLSDDRPTHWMPLPALPQAQP